jgi:amino-acid N-acetyltransferase
VAVAVAGALGADKLILFEDSLVRDAAGSEQRDLPLRLALMLAAENPSRALGAAIQACQAGVERSHVLDWKRDGALLSELFTRDGIGTMINRDSYESIRVAGIEDVGGILELIEPLERDGTLVRRSRERLETEIDCFSVVERDGAIIACAALYADQPNRCGELACVATEPDYRRSGRANRLLDHIEARARAAGIERLYVLTTRTAHWFVERGFAAASLSDLPGRRREMYNFQRNSQVFIKAI